MKIGCLQFKPELFDVQKNINRIRELIAGKDFDILVIPELANSGYLFSTVEELDSSAEEIPYGEFSKALLDISKEHDAHIVSGICERSSGRYFNSALLVYPTGEVKTYRKIHLFQDEKMWFSPGNTGLNVFQISSKKFGTVTVGIMICFDWIFPESARTLALKGAQIICHPSNLVLQYCQRAMFTRALENRVFTITANRTGKEAHGGKELKFTGESVIVDPKGNYLYRASEDSDECITLEIDPSEAFNKNVTGMNNIFKDRRVEFYIK
jgi:predicted amidohydrolase